MVTLPDGVVLWPGGGGRPYALGSMHADFKIDAESGGRYSVSEWLLEPGCPGVGAHAHDANDDAFYVLEGRLEFLIDAEWLPVEKGAFIRIPAGVTHDYRNVSDRPARLLNFYIPGDFEKDMPAIVRWFAENG
ncbi:MAG: cupin domain-containing protein [Rhodospirillaceae bacterium]|nr:cupin domain-containing protein [Rhodospirillaceae bacterium]